MSSFLPLGLGWQPDLPDPRDWTLQLEEVLELLEPLSPADSLPDRVDWREYCAPVANQGELPTSAAHACVGLLQYFEKRALGRSLEPSRLFVHMATQRLLKQRADCSGQLRATWKAIARVGVPSEQDWPYEPSRLKAEPDGFTFATAQRLESLNYVRLDARSQSGDQTLSIVRSMLAAGFPSVLGFPVFDSISREPEISFPTVFDQTKGGHAVVAVGYDNRRRFRSHKGALLVRNSWGEEWGDGGYGWLPYQYVREQLAVDFWTLLRPRWLESGEFQRPHNVLA